MTISEDWVPVADGPDAEQVRAEARVWLLARGIDADSLRWDDLRMDSIRQLDGTRTFRASVRRAALEDGRVER